MDSYRCQKCRSILFKSDSLLNCHGQWIDDKEDLKLQCTQSNLLFIGEQRLPDWIRQQIDDQDWTKGRITCNGKKCDARIGSFNFIGGVACSCEKVELPHIQIIRSKVDEPVHVIMRKQNSSNES